MPFDKVVFQPEALIAAATWLAFTKLLALATGVTTVPFGLLVNVVVFTVNWLDVPFTAIVVLSTFTL